MLDEPAAPAFDDLPYSEPADPTVVVQEPEGLDVPAKRLVRYVGALLIYLAAVGWLAHPLGHDLTRSVLNEGPDQDTYILFLKWWPWAIAHGHNPFLFKSLTWPVSYNTAWLTSVPGPALVTAPITLAFGPILSWNLLVLLAPVSAALAMVFLLEQLGVKVVASWLGGFVFGFSSYMLAELIGHLHLIIVFPIPLLIAVTLRLIRGHTSRNRFIAIFAILAAFLIYTSTEIGATSALAGAIYLMLYGLWNWREFLGAVRLHARTLLAAVGVTGVLCAPLIWYLITGFNVSRHAVFDPVQFSTDALNLVVPTVVSYFGKSLGAPMAEHFTGNPSEQGGYLGLLLILVTAVAVAEGLSKKRWAWPLALWTGAMVVLSLGPRLHVDGVVTSLRLPWDLVARLPLLHAVLPARLMMYVFLGVATWVGLWCSWTRNRRSWMLRHLVAAVAVAATLGNPALFTWTTPEQPRAVLDGDLARWLAPGQGFIVVPETYSERYVSSLWPWLSDFRLQGTTEPWSYNPYVTGPGWYRWPFAGVAGSTQPPPGTAQELVAFVVAHQDSAVVVLPGQPAWEAVLRSLGWQSRQVGQATVYKVPQKLVEAPADNS